MDGKLGTLQAFPDMTALVESFKDGHSECGAASVTVGVPAFTASRWPFSPHLHQQIGSERLT
jgi:hypothetical protein